MSHDIRVANHSIYPVKGWKRLTVDAQPPLICGEFDGVRYVNAGRRGSDLWAIDAWLELQPFEKKTLDFSKDHSELGYVAPQIPPDPITYFGGPLTVCNKPLQIVGLETEGAAIVVRLRGRVTPMLNVEAWIRWYPKHPSTAFGEMLVVASNPEVPDVAAALPPGGISLAFGDALIHVAGAGWGQAVQPWTYMADGQARGIPFTVFWPRLDSSTDSVLRAVSMAQMAVCGNGLRKLMPTGNPRVPSTLDPVAWTVQRFQESLRRLHTWEPALLGPNPNSADSGEQEDEIFTRGETMLPGGVGAEMVGYAAALKLLERPCHHLKPSGEPWDPIEKLDVMFWHGRPHAATGDLFGKSRGISADEAHGRWGPDTEHWFYNGLFAASAIYDSYLLQWELENQARLFLFSQTLPSRHPTWFTSSGDAARARGWVLMMAVRLWWGLRDRALATRVRQRAIERIQEVYLSADSEFWDIRVDDPRLGPGAWVIAWQQAVGAYGLDLAGEVFGVPAARQKALLAAKSVLTHAWVKVNGRWKSRPQFPVIGGGAADEVFNLFGMCLAPAVVLKNEPQNLMAREIWNQCVASAIEVKHFAWLPPEVV